MASRNRGGLHFLDSKKFLILNSHNLLSSIGEFKILMTRTLYQLSNMIARHLLLVTLILLGIVLVNSNRNSGASFSPIREVSMKKVVY